MVRVREVSYRSNEWDGSCHTISVNSMYLQLKRLELLLGHSEPKLLHISHILYDTDSGILKQLRKITTTQAMGRVEISQG